MGRWCALLILTVFIQQSCQYKPVFLLHGLLHASIDLNHLAERISKAHPNTTVHNSNAYSNLQSLKSLPSQIEGELGQEFLNFSKSHPQGFHFVGYSQGALLGRALIETYEKHNVHNFIALAGPMAGIYGVNQLDKIVSVGKEYAHVLYYTSSSQNSLSVANYWNDPKHHEAYLRGNKFLPLINNEVRSGKSKRYKRGFTKLKNLVCIGGPGDEVITPYQSSFFSFYDENEKVINYKDRDVYKKDLFGLRTLDESKRLHIYEKDNVTHLEFPDNDDVIDRLILPHLD